jgi:integrase
MAKIRIGNKTKRGVYKNIVLDIGREVKIGVGYVGDTRLEQSYLKTLEMLESTIIRGDDVCGDLWKRINRLPARIQNKLVNKQLIVRTEDGPSLAKTVDEFIADKLPTSDPRTVRNYKNTLDKGLLTYLDRDRQIESVEAENLIDFIKSSSQDYRDSTVHNQIKRAKALFQFAVDEDYITNNPFQTKKLRELCSLFTTKLAIDREQKQVEIMTPDEVERLLHCRKSLRSDLEDKEWNALVWLLRYGGNRVSSYLVLRWSDINFETKQIRLRMKLTGKARKFTKGNKRTETVPLFPEMVTPLKELKELQAEGTEHVLNKIGNLDQKPEFETTNAKGERIREGRWETSLSETFKKILRRNKFKVWPQPFQAFRAYRGAELDRLGASQIELDRWIGNSAEVRKRHYSRFHMAGADRFTNQPRKTKTGEI